MLRRVEAQRRQGGGLLAEEVEVSRLAAELRGNSLGAHLMRGTAGERKGRVREGGATRGVTKGTVNGGKRQQTLQTIPRKPGMFAALV